MVMMGLPQCMAQNQGSLSDWHHHQVVVWARAGHVVLTKLWALIE